MVSDYEALQALCRTSLSAFTQKSFEIIEPSTQFEYNWHIDCIAEHLQSVYDGHISKLVINMPPRFAKTIITSVAFPAWSMGKNPSTKFMLTSFKSSLAETMTRKTRTILRSQWYKELFPQTVISDDMDRQYHFETTQMGQYLSSAMSSATGSGCDIQICFPYDEIVHTEKGQIKIGDIVENKRPIKVWSYNLSSNKRELKQVYDWKSNPASDVVKVTLSDGRTVRCTPDHKFLTRRGMVAACDLICTDMLPAFSRKAGYATPLSIVADGHVNKTYCLSVEDNHNFFCGSGKGIVVSNCDDPISPDEAMSDQTRLSAIETIRGTLFSRFNDPRKMKFVLNMQRLHEGDPSGDLLREGGWTHLKLPAEAVDKDYHIVLGNKHWDLNKGELLFPARFTREVLNEKRDLLGDYNYAGQFLQEPVPVGGGEFNEAWLQFYQAGGTKPKEMNIVILCDPAGGEEMNRKKRKLSDWTVFDVIGLAPDNNYYLLDRVRDRLNPTDRVETLFMLHRKWNALSGKPPKVGYEKYGMMTDTHYIREKQRQDAYNFPLIELGGSMMKEERIRRMIPDLQRGRWYFPATLIYVDNEGRKYDLIEEMKSEMRSFPRARHDDICFIADTMIATINGAKSIQTIKVGDLVLTPDGFRKVTSAGLTGKAQVVTNAGLTGTGNHPIYTVDKSYIPLDAIKSKHEIVRNSLCGWIKIALVKSLNSMESNTDEWAQAENIICRSQQPIKGEKILRACTWQFGNFILERQYQKAMIFIIRILTRLIASMKILSVYHVMSIGECLKTWTWKRLEKTLKKSGHWLLNGINQKKEGLGIVSTLKEITVKYLSSVNIFAMNAAHGLLQKRQLNFALAFAGNGIEKNLDTKNQQSKSSAQIAINNLQGHQKASSAQDHALIQDVYNLSVDGPNCYFANGILVHNCDAMSRIYDAELNMVFPKNKPTMVAKAYAGRDAKPDDWSDW